MLGLRPLTIVIHGFHDVLQTDVERFADLQKHVSCDIAAFAKLRDMLTP